MSEDSIFSEVSEELRSERMHNFWRQFGPWIIGAAVLIVVLVAANEGWRWYQNSVAAKSSDQFYAAFDLANDGDIAGAQAQLNVLVAEGSGEYPVLGEFAQAALLANDGKSEEALVAYDTIATNQSDPHLRDLAFLFAANTLVDAGDIEGVEARVVGLMSPDNALHNTAREILGLTQYAAGKADEARATFHIIADDTLANREQLQRIQLYEAQLQSEGAADPEAVTPDASATDNPAAE